MTLHKVVYQEKLKMRLNVPFISTATAMQLLIMVDASHPTAVTTSQGTFLIYITHRKLVS